MSDLRITDVDVHDESRLYDWWRVGRQATAEREFAFWPVWEVSRVALPAENPERLTLLLLAERDGEPVGSGLLVLPVEQDREVAFTELFVAPEARRAGVGTALERRIEEIAREHGRTRMMTEAYTPPGESSQGLRFLLDRGYSDAHLEEMKVLRMAEFADRVDALEAEHGPLADGYRLVFWDVEVPDEHIDSFCEVLSTFMSQIPLGGLELEDSEWTPQRLRRNEQRVRAQGRDAVSTAALAPDGSIAGFTEVRTHSADPREAHIGITIVPQAHRGHGLGMSLKLANHRELLRRHPDCEVISTSNAGVNQHMSDINRRLGYRVVEECHECQRELG